MIYEKCYAKINLVLNVVRKLENNYHELESIFCPIDLCDYLTLEENSDKDEIICNQTIPGENIIQKTLTLMKKKFHKEDRFVKIHLEKNIFIGAGLAGGSTDAAGTIRGLNKLWELNLDLRDMEDIAVQIGADVPFCLSSKIALVRGIGEKIELVPASKNLNFFCLLINPRFSVSTKEIFENYHVNYSQAQKLQIEKVLEGIKTGNFQLIEENRTNDLEKVTFALYPELSKIKEMLETTFKRRILMSGSGPTLYVLSPDINLLNDIKGLCGAKYLVSICRILS